MRERLRKKETEMIADISVDLGRLLKHQLFDVYGFSACIIFVRLNALSSIAAGSHFVCLKVENEHES